MMKRAKAMDEASSSQRASARICVRFDVPGRTDQELRTAVTVHNLSAKGILIASEEPLGIGQKITVELPQAENSSATIVWQSAPLFGCQFDVPLSRAALSAAKLRNNPSDALDGDAQDDASEDQPLARKLLRLRRTQGLSRAALSALTGLSKPSIWAWETGRTTPKPANLSKLGAVLNVSYKELLADLTSSQCVTAGAHDAEQPLVPGFGASSLRAAIEAAKETIAAISGAEPNKIKITIEY